MFVLEGAQDKPEIRKADAAWFVCDGCGGSLRFHIKKQEFRCTSCQAPKEMKLLHGPVIEHDFLQYQEREKTGDQFTGLASITCSQCGAESIFDAHETATVCPMCNTPKVFAEKQITGVPPDGLIPFQSDEQDAAQFFHQWIKGLWFAPNRLKRSYSEGAFKGVYLPFWTYDAQTDANYKGLGGKHHVVHEGDGKTRTEVRWYPISGEVSRFFNDIQVCASEETSRKTAEKILPFNTIHGTKPYSPEYLSGFFAEHYKLHADRGFEEAKEIMENELSDMAEQDIRMHGFELAQVQHMHVHYEDVRYKQVLLPVWLSSFVYSGKEYRCAVNGETGKVSGERPYSIPKIIVAIVLAIVLVGAVFYGVEYYENSVAPVFLPTGIYMESWRIGWDGLSDSISNFSIDYQMESL